MSQIRKPKPTIRDFLSFKETFLKAVEPLLEMRVRLRMLVIRPTYVLEGNTLVCHDDGFTPQMKETDKLLCEAIEGIRSIHEKQFRDQYEIGGE